MFSAIRHAATLLPEHRPDWRKHFVSRLQRATGGRAAFTRPGSPPSVGPATCKVSLNSPRNRKFSYISCYERNHHNLQHSCQRKSCIVGNVGARLCKEEECVENKRWCLCIDFDPVFVFFTVHHESGSCRVDDKCVQEALMKFKNNSVFFSITHI